jgi:hypothetical protein
MSHAGTRVALVFTTAAALTFTVTALAVSTPIDDVELEAAGGDAVFDAENYFEDCGATGDGECYFTPVDDGDAFGDSDAFDGGLALTVEGKGFVDPDENGDLTDQQLIVGPVTLAGLKVTRIERALPGSPTLRTLVKLKNTRKQTLRRTIGLISDLGSDSSTRIFRSSSGDFAFSPADRWVATTDDPTSPSDPPVTSVFYGKGKPRIKLASGTAIQGIDNLDASFDVRLKRRTTGYLLLFTELSDEGADAVAGTAKFNRKKLDASLKEGLSRSVRNKALNWDLAKKKGKKNRRNF